MILQAADLTKPVDKKMYKSTNPTCHDFNTVTMTADTVALVIGFSTGQIQLIDPIKKELSKLYNEEVSLLGMVYFIGLSFLVDLFSFFQLTDGAWKI